MSGSLKLSHHHEPYSETVSTNVHDDIAKNRHSNEEVFQQFTTCSEPTSPLRTSMQQQQPLHKLGQPSHLLSSAWERGKVNQLVQRYSSSSSNSSHTPRGSHSETRLKRSGSEDSSTMISTGMSTSNSAPNNISVEVGGRPRSWLGDTREGSRSPLDHQTVDIHSSTTGSKLQPRRTTPSSLPHAENTGGDASDEFVRKSHERVPMRRKKSETQSSPSTPSNSLTVEQGYGLEDDNALTLKKMSVKDRTATWERRTSISQAAANAGMGYDTLKRLSTRGYNRESPARQIPSLQRTARGRSESIGSYSDMDQTDGGQLFGKKSKSPNPTMSSSTTSYHSYTLPKASMSSSKPPLPYSSPGKLHGSRSDRSFSSSENLAKHISEQLKLPPSTSTMSSSISEEPDEGDYESDGKPVTRRASAEARMGEVTTAGNKTSSGIPVMTGRSVTPTSKEVDDSTHSNTQHKKSLTTANNSSRSQKTTSGIPLASRRTPSPLIDKTNNATTNTTTAGDKSKPTDGNVTNDVTPKRSTIPRPSMPSTSSTGSGNSQYRRSSADTAVLTSHVPHKGGSNKTVSSSSSGRSNSDASQQQQQLSLAARRLQKASSLSNITNDDNSSYKSKSPHAGGSNIPRPSSSSSASRLHPFVIKTPSTVR